MIAPIAAPALKMPWAKARSCGGNHSALALTAPGQLPASDTPSVTRRQSSAPSERTSACAPIETDQTAMAMTKPIRVPIRSSSLPNSDWPTA